MGGKDNFMKLKTLLEMLNEREFGKQTCNKSEEMVYTAIEKEDFYAALGTKGWARGIYNNDDIFLFSGEECAHDYLTKFGDKSILVKQGANTTNIIKFIIKSEKVLKGEGVELEEFGKNIANHTLIVDGNNYYIMRVALIKY
jgi:hypothetical protein